eukprot:Gregarina_sp_Poly_1__10873@NODE_846_length_5999_cov_216_429872_g611_i0_p3_GENE_NODE_846_length_5999_cov_216_429872_g611_i0NODE_846_length_5999_cov_216_429872_g611_i0_p3_ORF_typecomplete_len200_score20_83_NODE_846_length_5999_cov_216_429872_g611_i026383237
MDSSRTKCPNPLNLVHSMKRLIAKIDIDAELMANILLPLSGYIPAMINECQCWTEAVEKYTFPSDAQPGKIKQLSKRPAEWLLERSANSRHFRHLGLQDGEIAKQWLERCLSENALLDGILWMEQVALNPKMKLILVLQPHHLLVLRVSGSQNLIKDHSYGTCDANPLDLCNRFFGGRSFLFPMFSERSCFTEVFLIRQ